MKEPGMENYDLSHLPQPVHDAVLQLLETLVQAFPLAPAEGVRVSGPSPESPPRVPCDGVGRGGVGLHAPFPRSATELLCLDALAALAPMPATPHQVATMIGKAHLEVRTTLQALAMLGTVDHPAKGYYRHGPPAAAADVRPSARFASQIAALCAPTPERKHP
jgi:hypothetical protein